jgi:Reverse transcriptase (RNA-dependent DNA polymerase)
MWGVGLIVKLHRLGVRGRMLTWVDAYMRGRQCRAVVEGVAAEPKAWDLGIGQGGILGPLLFVAYYSDLPIPPGSGGKYADDCNVRRAVGRTTLQRAAGRSAIQLQLQAIVDWSVTWRMTFSPPKTEVLLLTPVRLRQHMLDHPLDLSMAGTPLRQVMEGGARLLGVWLDPHLRFECHVGKLAEKGWRRVQTLRQIAGTGCLW